MTALTARYAVLGNPVLHSQSPFIHARFAEATGEAIDYGRVLCPLDGFEASVRAWAAEGAAGCNITVPFKFEVIALATRVSDRARLAQAANLLRFDADGWFADNTDGAGLVHDIEVHAERVIAGSRVVLIGAGGAAAGVLGPLIIAGATEVVVANRTLHRAHALVERHAALARRHGAALRASLLIDCGERFDIVINGSASSLAGAEVPVPTTALAPGALAIDLMYGQAARPFVAWAEAHGAVGRDGLGMLVEQAAEAFFVWRGVRPATKPVLDALRAHLKVLA